MAEYGLIGGLVALLVLPALVLLGGNITSTWQNLGDGIAPKPAVAHTASGSTSLLGGAPFKVTTQNGNQLVLDGHVEQPLPEVIATLGANGATSLLANELVSVANQLLANGEITQAQHASLIELSNQGHYMAEVAGALEQAALLREYKNASDFFYQKIEFQGKMTTVGELYDQMGYSTPLDAYRYDPRTGKAYNELPSDLLHPTYKSLAAISSFLSIYHKLEANGALADPTIKVVVDSLSTKILLTNDMLTQSIGDVSMGYTISTDKIVEMTASKATHVDSAGICDAGDGTDSGVQCSS